MFFLAFNSIQFEISQSKIKHEVQQLCDISSRRWVTNGSEMKLLKTSTKHWHPRLQRSSLLAQKLYFYKNWCSEIDFYLSRRTFYAKNIFGFCKTFDISYCREVIEKIFFLGGGVEVKECL